MGIRDHGRAAGAGLCAQPADGECSGRRGGRQRPAPASPHHTRLWSAAAAIAADMLKIALFYPAGCLEMIS